MQKTITFFLIDDDEDDHEFFIIALEDADKDVVSVTAKNGREALDMLNSGQVNPDYIFLDLNMPQIGGLECLTELKKSPGLSHIPVIIFSTSSDPKDKESTLSLGAIDFITKPSKLSELTALLNAFMVNQHS